MEGKLLAEKNASPEGVIVAIGGCAESGTVVNGGRVEAKARRKDARELEWREKKEV